MKTSRNIVVSFEKIDSTPPSPKSKRTYPNFTTRKRKGLGDGYESLPSDSDEEPQMIDFGKVPSRISYTRDHDGMDGKQWVSSLAHDVIAMVNTKLELDVLTKADELGDLMDIFSRLEPSIPEESQSHSPVN